MTRTTAYAHQQSELGERGLDAPHVRPIEHGRETGERVEHATIPDRRASVRSEARWVDKRRRVARLKRIP